MKPQQLDVSLEPSDLIAVDKAQWEQADKTIRELRAENERLRVLLRRFLELSEFDLSREDNILMLIQLQDDVLEATDETPTA